MRLPYATPRRTAPPEQESAAEMRLRGRWLLSARAAWLAAVVLTITVCVATIPVEFARLQQVCFSADCEHPHLTLESLAELQAMGLSANVFALYFILATAIFASVWFVAGL